VTTADDCEHRLREIYGPDPRDPPPSPGERRIGGDLAADAGVIHVTAVGRTNDGSLATIAIGPAAPRSATDWFLLNAARARADAIVTTGRILRAEPDAHHGPDAAGLDAPALAAWRRRLGKREPPLSVVLTSGAALDFAHPFFRAGGPVLVVTGAAAGARLASAAERAGVAVAERENPGLRDTLRLLRDERGAQTIVVEAGPHTATPLYESPLAVDELMLSIYEEGPLSAELRAGSFLDEAAIERLFPARSAPRSAREASGLWSYRRYRRR